MNANDFLASLFPELGPHALIELRALPPKTRKAAKKPPNQFFHSIEQVVAVAGSLAGDYNVYFGASARKGRKGDRGHVRYLGALWADVDAKDHDGSKQAALAVIRMFRLQPSIIVDSGNGYHVYWLLKEPHYLRAPSDISQAEGIMKGLAAQLVGDAVWDVPRILRVPNTLNHNCEPPAVVSVIELNADRRYDLPDFDPYRTPDEHGTERVEFSDIDVDGEQALERAKERGLSSAMLHIITSGHLGRGWQVGCRACEALDHGYRCRSRRDAAVVCALLNASMTPEDIRAIYGCYPVGDKYREPANGDRYLARTIAAERAFVDSSGWKPVRIRPTESGLISRALLKTKRLVRLIHKNGGADVETLLAATRWSHPTLRKYLKAAMLLGLVAKGQRKLPGRGRPRAVYTATCWAPPFIVGREFMEFKEIYRQIWKGGQEPKDGDGVP